MAAFDFPNSPSNGDNYTANGITWTWDGNSWRRSSAVGAQGNAGASGPTGAQGATGSTGAQGAQGYQGQSGTNAGQGAQGAAGTNGAQGAQGNTGGGGNQGAQGAVGATGAQGNAGGGGSTGAQGSAGSTGIPTGAILIWSGAANAIPSGWALCNGSNSTPDLRGKFVVGYSNTDGLFDVGDTGGSKDATLVSHTHPFSTTTTGGNHNHQYIDQYVVINNGYRPWPASNNDCAQRNINTSGSGSHSHSISGTTDAQGSSATNANLPPYYALCYIMKT